MVKIANSSAIPRGVDPRAKPLYCFLLRRNIFHYHPILTSCFSLAFRQENFTETLKHFFNYIIPRSLAGKRIARRQINSRAEKKRQRSDKQTQPEIRRSRRREERCNKKREIFNLISFASKVFIQFFLWILRLLAFFICLERMGGKVLLEWEADV